MIAGEFKVGEHVLLKVKPKKISLKLGSCTKMVARFCGPFEILYRIGPVSYMLALPTSMNVHNVFHVSLLKKYVHDPNHVIDQVLRVPSLRFWTSCAGVPRKKEKEFLRECVAEKGGIPFSWET
jgi:hypothetical protein